jgi:hypothetical protein
LAAAISASSFEQTIGSKPRTNTIFEDFPSAHPQAQRPKEHHRMIPNFGLPGRRLGGVAYEKIIRVSLDRNGVRSPGSEHILYEMVLPN